MATLAVGLCGLLLLVTACSRSDEGRDALPDEAFAPVELTLPSGFSLRAEADAGLAGDVDVDEPEDVDDFDGLLLGPVVDIETSDDRDPLVPVEIRFPVSDDAPVEEQLIAFLDEESNRWIPVPTDVDGDELVAEVDHFSRWATVAGWVQYHLGRGLGNRAARPDCDGDLPPWASDFTFVEDDNAELFACAESNADGQLIIKVVNNRGYPVSVEFNLPFASEQTALPRSLSSAVLQVSEGGFDTSTRLFVLEGSEAVVTFDQPEGVAGTIEAHARRDLGTVLGFVVFELLEIAGADLPIGNGRTLGLSSIECVVSTYTAIETGAEGISTLSLDLIVTAISEFRGCIDQVVETELANFDNATNHPTAQKLRSASRFLLGLKAADYSLKAADLVINDRPGTSADLVDLSLRWRGRPPVLGVWEPTCRDPEEDWTRLFKNVGLQEEFSDTSRLWSEYAGWRPAVDVAIGPLADCDGEHLEALADFIVEDWADLDPNGAQVIAEALAELPGRCPTGGSGCGDDPPIFDEASTSTVMVVDVSSSMNDPSPVGQSGPKINAAIDAAQGLISVVEIDADQGAQHSVGIVAFSSSAQVVAASTTDLERASSAAGRLQARGDTDIGDGLGQGIQTILDSAELKRIVLLSDGEITAGLSQNRVLSDVVPLAVSRGITIDVIGFAARGSLDESFLQSIASATGGNVSFAATADDLRAQFIEARHETTGTVVVNLVGELDAGSDAAISEFDVPPASSQLVVTLGYGTASEIDPVLVDPFGRTLSSRSFRVVGTNPVTVAVDDPLPGQWSVHVNEPDDSAAEDRIRWRPPVDGDQAGAVTLQTTEGEGVPYLLVVSTRTGADPDPVFGLTRRSSLPWLVAGQLALAVALLFGGFHVLSSLARSPAAARQDADDDHGRDDSADRVEPGRRRLPFVVVVGFIVGLFLLVGFLNGGFGG